MRVLFVSSGLDPATGGTASAAQAIAIAAARAGLIVTLAHPAEEAGPVAAAEADLRVAGVTVEQFPFAHLPGKFGRLAVRWAYAPALDRWVRAHIREFDAVIVHSAWVATSLNAVRAARRAGVPVAMMPHECFTRFDLGHGKLGRLKVKLRDWYLRRLDRVIVSSELEKRESGLRDDPTCLVVAHPAVDETQPALPHCLPDPQQRVAGFLGRFHPKKNLAILILAMAHAQSWRLEIAGGGGLEAELRALVAARGLTDRVRFLGFLDAPAKAAFLARIDLLAVPSEFECFGMVAAEALGQGTGVLLSPTVGVADFIDGQDVGIIVPPRPDAIATALEKLAADTRLDQWAAKARPAALDLFGYRSHGERLAQCLATMVSSAPRNPVAK